MVVAARVLGTLRRKGFLWWAAVIGGRVEPPTEAIPETVLTATGTCVGGACTTGSRIKGSVTDTVSVDCQTATPA